MCSEDFEVAFHVRLAARCCANCKHGKNEYDGYATCFHPKRNDGGRDYEAGETTSKWSSYNTWQNSVCDLWEKNNGGEK